MESVLFESRYSYDYEGYNKIGPEGCQHMSKAGWKNLTYLELGMKIEM